MLVNSEYVFERQGLEIKTVAGIVIGRDSLGIAVHHDGLVTVVAESECGVTAAIIEFNPLPDPVRPAAENDDFFLFGRRRLVFFLVGRVEIGSEAFEFGGASIDAFINRRQFVLLAQMSDLFLCAFATQPPNTREPAVGEAHALGIAEHFGGNRFHRMLFQLKLHIVNLFELVEEPRIDGGHLCQIFYRVPLAQSVSNIRKPLRMRCDQTLSKNFGFDFFRPDSLARVQCPYAFEQSFFECAANGHHLADRFHLRTKAFIGSGEFLELPLRNFDYDIVEGRLKTGRSLASDVVCDLVERITDGQLGCDLCDGEPGGFGGQSGRARDTRVHFNHDHPSCRRMHGELNVRAAGLDADFADHCNRRIAHRLVLAVGECLRRGDSD